MDNVTLMKTTLRLHQAARSHLNEQVWTESELVRRTRVLEGETVVATARADECLRGWAEEKGLLVWIDRTHWTDFGNPFRIPRDGDRDQVCDLHAAWLRGEMRLPARILAEKYAAYLEERRPGLLARIPAELKGKVLLCWCHPERCHGDLLARLATAAHLRAPVPTLGADRK